MGRFTGVVLLALAVVGSGVAVVYVKHLTRSLFVELQALERAQDEMQTEWGRLELEVSAWASHERIRRIARERLDLYVPPGDAVVLVSVR